MTGTFRPAIVLLAIWLGCIATGFRAAGYAFDASGRIASISDGTSSATDGYVPNSPLIQQVQLRNGSTVTVALTRAYDR